MKKQAFSAKEQDGLVPATRATRKKNRRKSSAKRPRAEDLSRKSPNQDRAKRTVAKILAAASEILSKGGADRLTMRRIASTAGVSVGLAYDYFPSKQAVLYRVYEARLAERLEFFDAAFDPENALPTFAESFDHYLELQRSAGFPSRLDLELQNAIERDDELARMTRHYEDELSLRYVNILRRYGSEWTDEKLMQLAKFAHRVDHANLKLQRQARPGNRGFYGRMTTEFFYFLAEQSGADTGRIEE